MKNLEGEMSNAQIPQEILYSPGANDEQKTPAYAIYPLLKYIDKNKVVWCPFDDETSEFVKVLRANGNKVIFSHLKNGQDFYKYEPKEEWDIILSNPPFTNKRGIFQRALSFNKPFLLLMPATWFNDSALSKLFGEGQDIQILFFNKRIKFTNEDGIVQNKITFASCFIGQGILPRQIVFEKI